MSEYHSSLTGQQMDDALLQMNARIPEGWAVGQKDGTDVSPSSPFYHNNAKYYANVAQSAVPVGNGAVLWNQQQNLQESDKAQARSNIGAINGDIVALRGWNQIFTTVATYSTGGITITFDSSTGTINCVGTATNSYFFLVSHISTSLPITQNHKYYCKTLSGAIIGMRVETGSAVYDAININGEAIWSPTHSGYASMYKEGLSVGETINYSFKPMLIDLTALFGAGNEPTTVAEFKAMFPSDYYPYHPIGLGSGNSNRNLLDNWWFGTGVINQRGANSYDKTGTTGYGIDRWISRYSTLTINSGYITLVNNLASEAGVIRQIPEPYLVSYLSGKIVTISILLNNGHIFSGTGVYGSQIIPAYISDITVGNPRIQIETSGIVNLLINSGVSIDVKAVKLELGNVSTLLYDTAPDTATESLKCKKYCVVTSSTDRYYGDAGVDNKTVRFLVPTPVKMRTTPSLSVTTLTGLSVRTYTGAYSPSSVTLSVVGLAESGVLLQAVATTQCANNAYMNEIVLPNAKIIISADLL